VEETPWRQAGVGRMRLTRNSLQEAGYSFRVGVDMRYGRLDGGEGAENGLCSLFDVVWVELAIVAVAFVGDKD
jgi:hypothetical protein